MKGPKFRGGHTEPPTLSGILYFVRSAAYCQTCDPNSCALRTQTRVSGLALCSRTKKIPMCLLVLHDRPETSAVLAVLRLYITQPERC